MSDYLIISAIIFKHSYDCIKLVNADVNKHSKLAKD